MKPSAALIKALVAAHYGVTVAEIDGRCRLGSIVRPRQVAMYLVRQHTDWSLPEIGRSFGGRHHATVLSAVHSVGHLLAHQGAVAADMAAIREALAR